MNDLTSKQGVDDREEIRTPANSLIPLAAAAGITLTLVGLVISWLIFAGGVIVTLLALVSWVRSTRTLISELPSDRA